MTIQDPRSGIRDPGLGFKDSTIRGFQDSRIRRFEDSRIPGFEDERFAISDQ